MGHMGMHNGTLSGTQFVKVQCSSVRIFHLDHNTRLQKPGGWGVADPAVAVVILINSPQKKIVALWGNICLRYPVKTLPTPL